MWLIFGKAYQVKRILHSNHYLMPTCEAKANLINRGVKYKMFWYRQNSHPTKT